MKLKPDVLYRWRLKLKGCCCAQIRIRLGHAEAAAMCRSDGDAVIVEGTLSTKTEDAVGCFSILAVGEGRMLLENVSVLPDDAVLCGLHSDVIALLKSTHPHSLRFPGGCYAEFYDWKQSLLDPDDRDVISSKGIGMDFMLGPTFHQDPMDMSLDDFVAVCRMVGAQPQYTVRITDSTPEDAAALVEYANGSAETKWGAVRASRGHIEPYGIRRWYVGNEIAWAVATTKNDPIGAARQSVALSKAMKQVDPSIELVPSTWPLTEWGVSFAAEIERLGGAELFDSASYHQYLLDIMLEDTYKEPSTVELAESCLRAPTERILPRMRQVREELMAAGPVAGVLPITMDEWNYQWKHHGHPVLALYSLGLFNVFVRHSAEIGLTEALFFHPINEGIIGVTPDGAVLEDSAKAWQMAQYHSGKNLLPIVNPQPDHPVDAAASIDGDSICVTLVNRSLREEGCVSIPDLSEAKVIVAECWKAPGVEARFHINAMQLHTLTIDADGTFTLPPASMACIRFER